MVVAYFTKLFARCTNENDESSQDSDYRSQYWEQCRQLHYVIH
jgi:hypothetical protein